MPPDRRLTVAEKEEDLLATKTTTPVADEIDVILGAEDLDAVLNQLPSAAGEEEEVFNLQELELSGVVEMDFRLLTNGAWYDAVIASAKQSRSSAGNKMLEFIFLVEDGAESTATGVTVTEYAICDSRQPKALWKIKKIARQVGLLSDNGLMLTSNAKDFIGRRIKFQNKVDSEYNPNQPRNKVSATDFPTTPNTSFAPSKKG